MWMHLKRRLDSVLLHRLKPECDDLSTGIANITTCSQAESSCVVRERRNPNEVMDSAEEAEDDDAMDHTEVNRRLVDDL